MLDNITTSQNITCNLGNGISTWSRVTSNYSCHLRQPSSDSESDDDGDDDSSSSSACGYGTACLSAVTLESLHSLGGPRDQSSYAVNGTNRKRMKTALKGVCKCGCTVPLRVLEKTCNTFWGLPKSGQDAVLWSLQAHSSASKTQWSIDGQGSFPLSFHIWHVLKIVEKCHDSMPLMFETWNPVRTWGLSGSMASSNWSGEATPCSNQKKVSWCWWKDPEHWNLVGNGSHFVQALYKMFPNYLIVSW